MKNNKKKAKAKLKFNKKKISVLDEAKVSEVKGGGIPWITYPCQTLFNCNLTVQCAEK